MKALIKTSTFQPGSLNGAREYHSIIRIPETGRPFGEQMRAVVDAIAGIAGRSEVRFVRFFLSDVTNQQAELAQAMAGYGFPVSYIGQPPLDGTKIAAWVYAVDAHESAYAQLWSAGITFEAQASGSTGAAAAPAEAGAGSVAPAPAVAGSEAQMGGIFRAYESQLRERGMSIAGQCIRTWIFVHDVDVNYGGIVRGRREYFDEVGLTSETHYIASTGIEGSNADVRRLVTMDALAIRGLEPSQIQYLYAKDHLSPTYDYGVTFERGTAVHYGDRTHAYISGTASIDHRGQVLHLGDVILQAGRMLENISALLSETGATLSDISAAIVYLRDPADYPAVKGVIGSRCPGLNAVYVLAPVCRPTWLVEMECIAVTGAQRKDLAGF